ncbi:MAG: tetratricopeptide repeat protein, partial [Deltaproteobacteria bacterium]|nr:tetratricopeptide repeat protein [Deltaproteobacteria bacterium]
AVLFVAPLFAGMSLPATALYWLVLLFGYCGTRERIAVCGFGAGCAVLPAAVGAICFCLYLPQSEIVGTLWRVNYGYWTSATIDHLEDISQRQPDDIDVLMTLGLAHKREQNYRTARRYYEKAMAAAPRNYKTHVNIGNVFLATGRWEQAVAAYKEAAVLAPTASAAAHFNLARAYQQRFMFKEAEQELFAAKRIAADRIDRQLGLYSENYNRMLLDELPGRSNLLLRGYRDFLRESQITAGVWALLFPGIPLQYAPAFFLGIVFFCLISVRRDRVRIAVSCRFCGKTMCRRCQVQLTDEIGCNQCRNFFHKKERIGARAKAEKMKQILRHRNMRSVPGNVLAVCLPGAGHMWKGQVLRGSLYLFVFLCFMGRCVGLVVWENPADVAGVLGLSALSVWGGGCFVLWCCLAADGARIKVSEVDDILLK